MTKVTPYLPIRRPRSFTPLYRLEGGLVAAEAERDNEGVLLVEEMALPFHLGSQEGKSEDSDKDEDHEQTTDANDMKSQELRMSITALLMIVTIRR